jgi:hypothetical protein
MVETKNPNYKGKKYKENFHKNKENFKFNEKKNIGDKFKVKDENPSNYKGKNPKQEIKYEGKIRSPDSIKKKIYKGLVLSLSSLIGVYLFFLKTKPDTQSLQKPIPEDTVQKAYLLRKLQTDLKKCEVTLSDLWKNSKHAKILEHMVNKHGELLALKPMKKFTYKQSGGGLYPDLGITDEIIKDYKKNLEKCKKDLKNFEKNILVKIKETYNKIQELKSSN